MSEIIQTLSKVKNYNSQKMHYEAPYLTGDDMENIEYALEKQIPKKPGLDDIQNVRYTIKYKCPACGGKFTGTRIADYCYHCGQKLDWSEIDERD